ncbi:MAG: SOS response-associated peptidase [Nitrococcus sp.]|nr:SOS response-associated peptidase [Nitrococcus sp.]
MCGRFVRHTHVRELTELVGALDHPADPGASYNITPSQDVLNAHEHGGRRVLVPMRWGLVPRWAKDAKKIQPINARAETVASNGVFRLAFRTGRTLIPADGFYEWMRSEHGKQPFYVYRCDGKPSWFAGVSDTWQGAEQPLTTCAIITTAANEDMQPIHHRMPVILTEDSWDTWLDPHNEDWAGLQRLLRPSADGFIALRPVSTRVNNPRNDLPELITALPGA